MPTTKICAQCGALFVEPYPYMQRQFCSRTCNLRAIHATQHPGPYLVQRTCAYCGRVFAIRRHILRKSPRKGRFCSPSCRSRAAGRLPKGTRKPVVARFLARLHRLPGSAACWLWIGDTNVYGYGVLSVRGRIALAHRLSYEVYVGPIPDGLLVCHDCPGGANPLCVNPDHLYLGTPQDNADDAVRAGGRARKLTPEDVRIIRLLLESGVSQYDIAAAFGVARPTIGKIAQRQIWQHVP